MHPLTNSKIPRFHPLSHDVLHLEPGNSQFCSLGQYIAFSFIKRPEIAVLYVIVYEVKDFAETCNMHPLNVQRKIVNPGSRGPHLLRAPVSREF